MNMLETFRDWLEAERRARAAEAEYRTSLQTCVPDSEARLADLGRMHAEATSKRRVLAEVLRGQISPD